MTGTGRSSLNLVYCHDIILVSMLMLRSVKHLLAELDTVFVQAHHKYALFHRLKAIHHEHATEWSALDQVATKNAKSHKLEKSIYHYDNKFKGEQPPITVYSYKLISTMSSDKRDHLQITSSTWKARISGSNCSERKSFCNCWIYQHTAWRIQYLGLEYWIL